MKRALTVLLQVLVLALGVGVFVFMIWEPQLEGVNVGKTLSQIYFGDPFLAYVYVGSIPFFVGVYQVFKLLEFVGRGELASARALQALRTIKYCAFTFIAFLLGAEVYINIVSRRVEEDIAGGVMMGLVLIVLSAVVAFVASVSQKRLQTVAR